jgi:hypothetical protein
MEQHRGRDGDVMRQARRETREAIAALQATRGRLLTAAERLTTAAKTARVVADHNGHRYTVERWLAELLGDRSDTCEKFEELIKDLGGLLATRASVRADIREFIQAEKKIEQNDMTHGHYGPLWGNKQAMAKLAGFPGFREVRRQIKALADAGRKVSGFSVLVVDGQVRGFFDGSSSRVCYAVPGGVVQGFKLGYHAVTR